MLLYVKKIVAAKCSNVEMDETVLLISTLSKTDSWQIRMIETRQSNFSN